LQKLKRQRAQAQPLIPDRLPVTEISKLKIEARDLEKPRSRSPSTVAKLPTAFKMLMLSIFQSLLSQVLAPPHLHTAVLFTTSGELVSATSEPLRPKDEIRIVVGLSGEVWQETKEQEYGMVDCEVGSVLHSKC
jgi:hypothetical protein